MVSQPDLSLPSTIPEMAQYNESTLLPFALYTLNPLSQDDILRLRSICQSECPLNKGQEQVLLPPQSQFPGESLKAINLTCFRIKTMNENGIDGHHRRLKPLLVNDDRLLGV